MIEKDLYRNLPSVRDIRTELLHFSLVRPNQELKQSFQTYAALPVDEKIQNSGAERIVSRLRSFRSDCERLFKSFCHL